MMAVAGEHAFLMVIRNVARVSAGAVGLNLSLGYQGQHTDSLSMERLEPVHKPILLCLKSLQEGVSRYFDFCLSRSQI